MLEARLLGRFEVRLDGDPIDLASRPAQSLFAYLALNPNVPHRRERLAGTLWPDTSDANARNSLRHALWTLRRALGADGLYLLADDLTITLNADSDCRFDFAMLDQKPTVDWSADDLIGIVSEYGGDLLPGFYDEWVVLERQRLQVVFEHKMKLLLDRLVEARRWEDVLEWGERWIALGHVPEPAYRALMVAHAGLGDVSKMAATYRRCVDALKNELGVEPSEQTRTTYERLARGEAPPDRIAVPATQSAIAQEDMPPAPGEPPFKGLQYFDEADADLFFGRERLTARLVSRLTPQPPLLTRTSASGEGEKGVRFLAVVGASGSGKSSVVRAGLVPALKRGAPLGDGTSPPEDSTHWRYHVITPTAHPLEALALSLTRDSYSVTTTATLIDDLARDSRSLHLFVRRQMGTQGNSRNSRNSGNSAVLSPTLGGDWAGNHLLLVVDQFEELFTLCRDEAIRKAFIDNLLTAAVPPVPSVPSVPSSIPTGEGPTIVVIALRADFYAHCAEHAPLRDALAKHQEYIGRMSAVELRRTIEEPAKRGGWQFEPGLVDLLMRETGSEPGGLPLLSHALLETWQRRRGRTLTLRSYAESGGVHGAIAKTAESVYQRFTPEQQAIARSVFIRLTELGEGTQDTRRRAALSELITNPQLQPAVESVLKILADARLITTAEDTAEVAHEALIREWPTLRQWLSEDREGLRQHRHLTESAQEWEALGRDPGELYRGARLAQVVEWAEMHAGELNALERAYLDASREWAEREAAEREAQQQRELEAARQIAEAESRRAEEQSRAARQLWRRALALAGALVAAGVLALVAIAFGAQAEQESVLATSRELAAAAIGNLDVDAERSILLALHAMSAADTLEAQDALHRAVQASHVQLTLGEPGRTPAVWGVAFSPDGQWLATADSDGTAHIRDAASGEERLRLVGHTGELRAVAFSPDGTRVATAGEDGTVRVWNAANGEELLTLAAHSGWIGTVAFSPDGTRLATAGEDGTAKVWLLASSSAGGAASGRELIAFTGHSASVDHVAFSPDGEHLATVSADGTTKVWDAASGDVILTLDDTQDAAAFSPDGTRLAVSGFGGVVRVWDVRGGQPLLEWRAHSALIGDIAFSPDGGLLATAGGDGKAKVWDAASGDEVLTLSGHGSQVTGVAFSPHDGGARLATASRDGTAKVWHISPTGSRELLTVPGVEAGFSPDGTRLIAIGVSDPTTIDVRAWSASLEGAGQELLALTLAGHAAPVTAGAISPDGTRLAAVSADLTVRIWDAATGQELLAFPLASHTAGVGAAAFSPDGTRLATASEDGTAKVWDVQTGRELLTLSGHVEFVWSVAFSPDGKRLATAGTDKTARVWDAVTGQELMMLSGHTEPINSVAFSPDGSRLATGGMDGSAIVWEVASGRRLFTLSGHTATVNRVAFSPDGTRLATGSNDGTAKVWDAVTGKELLTLSGHSGWVNSVAFSPDGTRLATGSFSDGTVRVYVLRGSDLVTLARSRVTRSLMTEECQRFLHVERCP